MAWTNIPGTDIDQDSPITQTLMTAIRDNIILANNHITSSDLSSDATAEFTLDGSLYDGYMFMLQNVVPATDAVDLILRTSTDGGTTFDSGASDYRYATTNATSILICNSVGSDTNEYGISGPVFISGPHLAAETYVGSGSLVYKNAAGTITVGSLGGVRQSAADVDAVQFLFSSGNIESGTISMYGFLNTTG